MIFAITTLWLLNLENQVIILLLEVNAITDLVVWVDAMQGTKLIVIHRNYLIFGMFISAIADIVG